MVSASQSSNPLGATPFLDGEVPRTFTAKALEVISGGNLVNTSGATGDVGSAISSIGDGDLKVLNAQDPKLFNGIALNNAGSNENVTIARRGAYLMLAGGIVSGGALVGHNASGGVLNILNAGSVPVTTVPDTVVGRAITTSASGTSNFALVELLA